MAAMAAAAGTAAAAIGAHQATASSSSSSSSTSRSQQMLCRGRHQSSFAGQSLRAVVVRREEPRRCVALVTRAAGEVHGQNPEWSDDDYIVLGLAHCFKKDENGKLKDALMVEPVTAGTLECMENGGVTCYKCVTATTLGVALKEDLSLLPVEMQVGSVCDDFNFRAKCASRTWKRDHPQQNLLHLVPRDGVKSDYNFNLQDKRVLNEEVVVNDSDNIKQDMSIDVYGREKEEEMQNEIKELYSV